MNLLTILYHILLDFFFPKFCIFCGSYGKYLCLKCINSKFEFVWSNICPVCGKESFKAMVHKECSDRTYLDGLVFVVLYNKPVEKVMYVIKHSGFYSVLDEVISIMVGILKIKKIGSSFVLVSISTTRQKKRTRGFNQSEIIATRLAEKLGLNYLNILVKVKKTKSQFGLNREARHQNLKNSFVINCGDLPENIVLIDDVYTTGSTLNECAKVLKAKGAKKVIGFVFARSGINW